MSRIVAPAILCSIIIAGSAAQAETPAGEASATEEASAVELFEESERLYGDGQYAEAASLLERAYAMTADPILLYNLARTYERLDDTERAVATYRRYLNEAPEAPDRATVEERIAALTPPATEEPPVDEEEPPVDEEEPTGEPAAADHDSIARTIMWPLVISGSGLLVLGTGLILGGLASNAHDEAAADPNFMSAHASQESAGNLATSANVLFAIGGAALVAGVVWGLVRLLRLRRTERARSVTPLLFACR